MGILTIAKQLLGIEDVLIGQDSVSQTRNGTPYTINKLPIAFVAKSLATFKALDVTDANKQWPAALLTTSGDFYKWDSASTATPDDFNVILSDTSATGRWLLLSPSSTLGNFAYTDRANVFSLSQTIKGATPLVLEGGTDDTFETSIALNDPTADRTWTIPDETDTFAGLAKLADTSDLAKGDALIGGKRTGIGTAAFTIHSFHENRTVNVKTDFGAIGNGVTDDTVAILAAIAFIKSIGGGVIFLPASIYKVISGLVVDSNNVYFVGDGWASTITYDLTLGQTVDVVKFNAVTYGGFRDIYLNCSNADATAGNAAIAVRGASSFIEIEHALINNHNSAIILEDPVTDCLVDRCVTKAQLRHSIRQIGAARCAITRNNFTGSLREPIAFNAPNSGTVQDIEFENNYIEAPNGFDFIRLVASTTPTYKRLHFNKNTFIDNGTAKDGINGNGLAIIDSDFNENTFVGGRSAIELYLSSNCSIIGNRIDSCEESGLALLGSSNNIIAHNRIKNCDQISTSGNKGGITLRKSGVTGSSNNVISDNRCYDNQGTKTQTYGLKIIDVECVDNEVNANNFDGNLTGKISDLGIGTRVDNPLSEHIRTLANDATPSVKGGKYFLTGGTTAITDFDDGVTGQEIIVLAEHNITITDGTNIFLKASANLVMTVNDSLTLICKADNKWYET